jgi:predicted  nucleic acid-binding Zn-ribbon protein
MKVKHIFQNTLNEAFWVRANKVKRNLNDWQKELTELQRKDPKNTERIDYIKNKVESLKRKLSQYENASKKYDT